MTFDSVVFDLDGTLIDSVHDVRANLNRVLEGDARRPLTTDETKGAMGHGARALVTKALELTGEAGSTEEIGRRAQEFLDLYVGNPARLTPVYPGVTDVLGKLSSQGLGLGICTNKPETTTQAVLDALGLTGFFRAVTCGDKVPHRKPDGRHVLATMDMMGARAAAMVGDSETDMAAGRDAGIPVIAVGYGYRRCPADELDSDILIGEFADLPAALRRLQGGPSR